MLEKLYDIIRTIFPVIRATFCLEMYPQASKI